MVQACTLHCLRRSWQGQRAVVTDKVINTEWDGCDHWGLCDPISQYVMHNLKTFKGKQNATWIPVLGLLCLLIRVVSAGRGSSSPFLQRQGGDGQENLSTLKGSPSWRGSARFLLAVWVRCAESCGRWSPWQPRDWPAPSWGGREGMVKERANSV